MRKVDQAETTDASVLPARRGIVLLAALTTVVMVAALAAAALLTDLAMAADAGRGIELAPFRWDSRTGIGA